MRHGIHHEGEDHPRECQKHGEQFERACPQSQFGDDPRPFVIPIRLPERYDSQYYGRDVRADWQYRRKRP